MMQPSDGPVVPRASNEPVSARKTMIGEPTADGAAPVEVRILHKDTDYAEGDPTLTQHTD